ncbi:hypothetical protein E1A91_D04G133500v1 [Gossypium mustelinum]|uniref:Auxin-responsive protein n=1 Tax=Gossypium mustelinum TaxID=34275 RepID=A0A5D2VDK1_GOSMU|nr:hypothetical protein E1A91_D04G133500v1 [Gossypium mustelinum]
MPVALADATIYNHMVWLPLSPYSELLHSKDFLWDAILCVYIYIHPIPVFISSAQRKLSGFLRSLHSLPHLVQLNILPCFKKANKMISVKKFIKLARKWQKMATIKRKRITLSRTSGDVVDTTSCSTSSVVKKGHFVVYSTDEKRFVLPLEYLKNKIVMELFDLAEEFGLSSNGALILPCDATFMEYVIALIKRKPSKAVEQALILSIASDHRISSSLYQQETSQQLPICSF